VAKTAEEDFVGDGVSANLHRNAAQQELLESAKEALYEQAQADGTGSQGFNRIGSGGQLGDGKGFKRTAEFQQLFQSSSASDTVRTPLLYVDPLWDTVLLLFPEDNLKEVNKRLRHYYKFQPYVGSVIDIHSTFPLSDFELHVDDAGVKSYFNYTKEKLDLLQMAVWMLRDKHLLGESVWYGNWDKTNFEWQEWNQYPPEYIDIKRTYVSNSAAYFLLPDPELQKIVGSNDPIDKAIVGLMPKQFVESVGRGKPHMLDGNRVVHFANRTSKYTLRGLSLVKRVLKDLLFEDKLRYLQYTFVDRHMFPIKIFKLGSESKGWIPSKKHFDKFKQLLVSAANDPDYNIIYHFGLTVDYVGTKDKIENLIPWFDWVGKRIMVGLFANEALIGGEAPSYAGQTVNLKMLFHRYITDRAEIEKIFKYKIFLPMAREQQLIRPTKAEVEHKIKIRGGNIPDEKYFLPSFIWQKLNLLNNTQEQEMMLRLRNDGRIPQEIINDVFGLTSKTIVSQFQKEEATYLDKDWQELKKAYLDDAENKELRDRFLKGEKVQDILNDLAMKEQVQEKADSKKPGGRRPPKLKDLNEAPAGGMGGGPMGELPPPLSEPAKTPGAPGAGESPEEKETLPTTPGAEGPAI
jgi:hypothetical protein